MRKSVLLVAVVSAVAVVACGTAIGGAVSARRREREVIQSAASDDTAAGQDHDQEQEREEDHGCVEACIWEQRGKVCMSILNPDIIECRGELSPAVSMTPLDALQTAHALLTKAFEATQYRG